MLALIIILFAIILGAFRVLIERLLIMKDLKIRTIGDTHGRITWKIACFGSESNYERWRSNCDDPNHALEFPIYNYDRVIFIGDYVDSFLIAQVDIKRNLGEIIHLKEMFTERVILLLGNHDVSYINRQYCSGYQAHMQHDYASLFATKIKGESIFQAAYQYKDWLWTHAGVTMGFYNEIMEPLKNDKNSRFSSFYKGCKNLADILNFMYTSNNEDIFRVGRSRGGWSNVPGPFWADKGDLSHKPMIGINQIVGHTPVDLIKGIEFQGGRYSSKPVSIYFIDTLEYGKNQVLDTNFNEEPPLIEVIDLVL